MTTFQGVDIIIRQGDATGFPCDVLALKYAQALYGVDRQVVSMLDRCGARVAHLPEVGEPAFIGSPPTLAARSLLLVGTRQLRDFTYADVRTFGELALSLLDEYADTGHDAARARVRAR